jgi:hypothetical protein
MVDNSESADMQKDGSRTTKNRLSQGLFWETEENHEKNIDQDSRSHNT